MEFKITFLFPSLSRVGVRGGFEASLGRFGGVLLYKIPCILS